MDVAELYTPSALAAQVALRARVTQSKAPSPQMGTPLGYIPPTLKTKRKFEMVSGLTPFLRLKPAFFSPYSRNQGAFVSQNDPMMHLQKLREVDFSFYLLGFVSIHGISSKRERFPYRMNLVFL
ncbi:MAG: hypothetical protein MRY81_22215 [Donghicola eburneus]|nr:hypothetical protein [Donghicola eburneus]MCI5042373.1 hypothetical protein [Donghicola eburneus]